MFCPIVAVVLVLLVLVVTAGAWWLVRMVNTSPSESRPDPELELVTLGTNGRPTWMSTEDWKDRLAAYRRRGRSDAEIREISEYLERRGPRIAPTAAESIARATRQGIVSRTEYMSPEEETRALAHMCRGLPNARLEHVRDRLLVVTPRGWVNPRSRGAYRTGLYSFSLRGTSYYEAAVMAGRFTPGAPLRLVREPDNPHDPNAIAVYTENARRLAGYVPKGQARRLAPLLDAGTDLVAVSTRGAGVGVDGVTPHLLVCERTLYHHLTR